ncbi:MULTISPECIES: hypothetical protein [Fusobacterium]|uniref:hypothetical protein n=1 Tax=Fusobacterium TaxID=848 RepID=UPI001F2E3642|nr:MULTISPECIES: hypothetical protein [Fusobacterium]MCF2613299.1 hypothetical protein [Fusobacterium perfoetens]MDY2980517.1 hypothetical protein [Fusobacterium sp.]
MEIKVEDLLREIAELKIQLSKALARIEELEKVENFFKEQLIKAKITHADETGTKVNGSNRWIHSFSS